MIHNTRFILTTLTLAVALLPVMAFAVEVPGEVVHAPSIDRHSVDHRAAWEQHLRAERAQRIADLRAYSAAGVFPRKRGEPGWHHQFLDADGNPCAVASLIWTDGRDDLVRATAATHNDIVLAESADGPLLDWVLASGLTLEEVAIIQEPGWEPLIDVQTLTRQDPAPSVARAERQEVRRLRRHLNASVALLEADTESAIWKAMQRVGNRVQEAPPQSQPQASVVGMVTVSESSP